MIEALTLLLLLAESPAEQTTIPRQADSPKEHAPPQQGGMPADPLFDKPLTATDDAAFVRAAVESGRQGVLDARAGESGLSTPELRAAAAKISRQQTTTLDRLEAIAKAKGWELPPSNPGRAGTVAVSSPARMSADFIILQIAQHQATIDQFRAQAAGKGDPELRRVLREALPGYQKNLEMLLGLKL
jgi:predicted outer membrane protein